MAVINIENMYRELLYIMKNNFSGTPEHKYELAKNLFLESIEVYIEGNKEELLKEVGK